MARAKRGSEALDKATRRIAGMRSMNDPLDFGYGLSLADYENRTQVLQTKLLDYNTKLSELDQIMEQIKLLEQALNGYSEKMLMGVATRYGKQSVEYIQAGGKPRKRATRQSASTGTIAMTSATHAVTNAVTQGNGATIAVN
ncbi:MAG: hypothetical protein KME16_24510 [Scytolyngbya sp. HA4215-MV1]|jgi:hypothetical protein|nr:hypothetical protein [Scytolyngbya sp. HA4215-MV1]